MLNRDPNGEETLETESSEQSKGTKRNMEYRHVLIINVCSDSVQIPEINLQYNEFYLSKLNFYIILKSA